MFATSTFESSDFEPKDEVTDATIALPVGYSRMRKAYAGQMEGSSITLFTAAFDAATGTGTDRTNEYGLIVPASGTEQLAGITGRVALRIEPNGTHHLDVDYALD